MPVVFVSVWLLLFTSCGGDGGERSPVSSLSGNYTGTVQDRLTGPGTIQATLSEADAALSGTFQATFTNPPNNTSLTVSGTVSGTVNDTVNDTVSGTSVVLTLIPTVPTMAPPFCPNIAVLTQPSAGHFTGAYEASECTIGAAGGTIDLTRQ